MHNDIPVNFKDTLNQDLVQLYELVLNQSLAKADAIIWIQGDRFDRGSEVVDLYKQGMAKTIVVTGNNVLCGVGPRPGENDASIDELVNWLKNQDVPDKDIIVDSDSLNTAQQAKNTIQLAKEKMWKHIILVSSPYHQPRVFLTFLQYHHVYPELKFVNRPAMDLSWDEVASGRNKTRAELVGDEARKITTYTVDVAEPKIGIEYLLHYEN